MKENGIPTDALESGRRRVLIVDDDQAVVDLISEVLAGDARFETKVVNNGFGAGMLAKEYHPDLIILDVMLPDINGQAGLRADSQRSDDVRHQDHLHFGDDRRRQDPGFARVRSGRFPAQTARYR